MHNEDSDGEDSVETVLKICMAVQHASDMACLFAQQQIRHCATAEQTAQGLLDKAWTCATIHSCM
jgi:hypothetical protein